MGSRRDFVLLERQGASLHYDGRVVVEGDSLEEIADSLEAMTGEFDLEVDDGGFF